MGPYTITPSFRALLDDDRLHHHRVGFWLPRDRKVIIEWTKQLMKRIKKSPPQQLDPTLQALRDFVTKDTILQPLSEDMFNEVPNVPPYNEDPEHYQELRSFDQMLNAFNVLLTMGPEWNDIANKVG